MFFSDQLTAALHVARVAGVATPERVVDAVAVDDATAASLLARATADGLLQHRPTGAMAGWTLTAAGRDAHAQRVRADLDRSGFADRLAAISDRFVEINGPFKELCMRWQLEGQPSDCIDELGEIHACLSPVLAELAALDNRFAAYGRRLDAALDRLRAGDASALTKPLSGSYHDVWMEVHQDLIVTMCRERVASDGH